MRPGSRSQPRRELNKPTAYSPAEAGDFERDYPGSRWLAYQVTRRLYLVGAKVDALISGVARRYGLSHAALNALAVIEAAGSSLPVGEVTAQMHVSTATMTSVLDTLERKGYIRRQPDPVDRRRVLVDLTPDAQTLLDEVLPAVQQAVAATLTGMDDQSLAQLLDVLDATSAAIDAAPRDLPPPAKRRTPRRLRRTAAATEPVDQQAASRRAASSA